MHATSMYCMQRNAKVHMYEANVICCKSVVKHITYTVYLPTINTVQVPSQQCTAVYLSLFSVRK